MRSESGKCNSTRIDGNSGTDEQCEAKKWWLNKTGERKQLKIELESSLEEKYSATEYDSSFEPEGFLACVEANDSNLQDKNATFPMALSPEYDLQVVLQVSIKFCKKGWSLYQL